MRIRLAERKYFPRISNIFLFYVLKIKTHFNQRQKELEHSPNQRMYNYKEAKTTYFF